MIFEPISPDDVIVTDTRNHTFPVSIAIKYSVHMALWIGHLAHWTERHFAHNENIHDGLCWNYTTVEALGSLLPYLTLSQRRKIIDDSVDEGLVVKGNYNHTKYDRTVWYALTPKAFLHFSYILSENNLKALWLSICEKTQMDLRDFTNRFVPNHQPIPDTKPDTKTNINNKGTSDEVTCEGKSVCAFKEDDFEHNQTDIRIQHDKGLDVTESPTKSDYRKNRTKNNSVKSNITHYDIKDILSNNIFQIPEQIIQDWMANRKKKRAAVTLTAWNKIHKELTKCKDNGIDPIDAFETMVAAGWLSMKVEYFLTKEHLEKQKSNEKRIKELQELAVRRKQQADESKRAGKITQVSETARRALRDLVGSRAPDIAQR